MQGSVLEQEEKVKSGIFLQSQGRLLWLQECSAPFLDGAGACWLIRQPKTPLLPSLYSSFKGGSLLSSLFLLFFFFSSEEMTFSSALVELHLTL